MANPPVKGFGSEQGFFANILNYSAKFEVWMAQHCSMGLLVASSVVIILIFFIFFSYLVITIKPSKLSYAKIFQEELNIYDTKNDVSFEDLQVSKQLGRIKRQRWEEPIAEGNILYRLTTVPTQWKLELLRDSNFLKFKNSVLSNAKTKRPVRNEIYRNDKPTQEVHISYYTITKNVTKNRKFFNHDPDHDINKEMVSNSSIKYEQNATSSTTISLFISTGLKHMAGNILHRLTTLPSNLGPYFEYKSARFNKSISYNNFQLAPEKKWITRKRRRKRLYKINTLFHNISSDSIKEDPYEENYSNQDHLESGNLPMELNRVKDVIVTTDLNTDS